MDRGGEGQNSHDRIPRYIVSGSMSFKPAEDGLQMRNYSTSSPWTCRTTCSPTFPGRRRSMSRIHLQNSYVSSAGCRHVIAPISRFGADAGALAVDFDRLLRPSTSTSRISWTTGPSTHGDKFRWRVDSHWTIPRSSSDTICVLDSGWRSAPSAYHAEPLSGDAGGGGTICEG